MNISILLLKNSLTTTVMGPMEIFSKANMHLKPKAKEASQFNISIVSYNSKMVFTTDNYPLQSQYTVRTAPTPDLIIIPAMGMDIEKALVLNKEFIPWITRHYEQGTELASICTGTFLLAATGILNNKKTVTTHWFFENAFRKMFPDIRLECDKILTDADGIYTSAGISAYANLSLYLVEKFCGNDTASFLSKMFLIDKERSSQLPYAIFTGQKHHYDKEILKAQSLIEEKFSNTTIEKIINQLAIGKRAFIRRFKVATGNNPIEYLQRVRVEAAKRSLEQTRLPVNSIMSRVGYENSGNFRIVFKRYTGMSPLGYRKKYHKTTH